MYSIKIMNRETCEEVLCAEGCRKTMRAIAAHYLDSSRFRIILEGRRWENIGGSVAKIILGIDQYQDA